MANTNPRNIASTSYQFQSEYANIDANYGPWSSIQEYEALYSTTGRPSILPGTLIAIHNQTTDEVTLKMN
ncbi:MAG: hypothetical protein IKN86_08540 [Bacteroidaceae bacterium]|nr:hypothetical protein [Bacteroidaceae bacterium]